MYANVRRLDGVAKIAIAVNNMRNNQTKTTLSNCKSVNKRKEKWKKLHEKRAILVRFVWMMVIWQRTLTARIYHRPVQMYLCNERIYKITSTNLIYFI